MRALRLISASLLALMAIIWIAEGPRSIGKALDTHAIHIALLSTCVTIIEINDHPDSEILIDGGSEILFVETKARPCGGETLFPRRELHARFLWNRSITVNAIRNFILPVTTRLYVTPNEDVVRDALPVILIIIINPDLPALKFRLPHVIEPHKWTLLGFQNTKLPFEGLGGLLRFQSCVTSENDQSKSKDRSEPVGQVVRVGYGTSNPVPEPLHWPVLFVPLGGVLLVIGMGIWATAVSRIALGTGVSVCVIAVITIFMPLLLFG
jgi:hypothetical protein